MTSFVIAMEGVLRKVTDGSPLTDGIELIRILMRDDRNSFVYLVDSDKIDAEEWLGLQSISYDLVLLTGGHGRTEEMRAIRSHWGYPVDVVIEPDPGKCAELIAEGFIVLGFFHPYYARAEWRPGYEHAVLPWDELVAQMVIQGKGVDL